MEDLWTRVNDDVPVYMKTVCEKYNLSCVKISSIRTALVGNKFALIIGIDRFYANVYYLYMEGKELKMYSCGSYFAEKYDADDRVNLLEGEGADILLRNDLTIIANGLLSKWGNVLNGQTEWIENYKKYCRFSIVRILPEEIDKLMPFF